MALNLASRAGLRQGGRILWWRVAFIGAAAVAGALLAWGMAARVPSFHTARATFRFVDATAPLAGSMNRMREGRPILTRLLSEAHLLRSRQLIGSAIEENGLRLLVVAGELPRQHIRLAHFPDSAWSGVIRVRYAPDEYSLVTARDSVSAPYGTSARFHGGVLAIGAPPATGDSAVLRVLAREAAMRAVYGSLGSNLRENTNVVDVYATSSDPEWARATVNAMVNALATSSLSTNSDRARRRRIFLEGALADAAVAMREAGNALARLQERTGSFSAGIAAQKRQTELAELDFRIESLRTETESLNRLLTDSVPAAGADTVAQTRELRARIATLQTRARELAAARPAVISELLATTSSEAVERQLLERLAAARNLHQRLSVEMQRARIEEAATSGSVSIVELAGVPEERVPPRPRPGRGALAGAALAWLIVLVRSRLDFTFEARPRAAASAGVPVLATVPAAPRAPGSGWRSLFRFRGDAESRDDAASGELYVLDAPHSAAANAVVLLAAAVAHTAGQASRRILVTSCHPGEGKTVTISNLAIAAARSGLRVLLVDADLRRPRVHRLFEVPRSPGLAECVVGLAEPAQAIAAGPVAGLHVLPAGTAPPRPLEMLGSAGVDRLLDGLTASYDLILIDTSPVESASDAAALAPRVDGMIVVVRAPKTSSRNVLRAVQQLRAMGAHVSGLALVGSRA